jgi:2',3'-cyclic-nucleotide 2'-phosphodiesterase (5'-nucleotidase family)
MSNRRNFVKQGALAAGAIALLRPLKSMAWVFENPSARNLKTLTILHTSDLHAGTGSITDVFAGSTGALRTVTTTVNKLREQHYNVLLVNTGNLFDAAVGDAADHSKYFQQVQSAGYHAVLPGEKDLEKGAEYFTEIANRANLPVVATNSRSQGMLPYQVEQRGDIKVGIIGFSFGQFAVSHSLTNTAASLNKTAAYLKSNHGCSTIVCLSYNNHKKHATAIKNDLAIAAMSSGIDVIVSGNSNTTQKITRTVRNADKHEVLLASSGQLGSNIGRIDITYNDVLEKVHVSMSQIRA